ncbi:MAG: hypothetical protein JNG85_04365, partial [Spirochaetaceae bacterium]|nr:hypothetical protein [Spirochaetaceae bacterium]
MRRRLFAPLFLASLAALAPAPAAAASLDLGAEVLYARRGFDPAAAGLAPAPGTGEWTSVPKGSRSIRSVRDLGLRGVEKPGFLALG